MKALKELADVLHLFEKVHPLPLVCMGFLSFVSALRLPQDPFNLVLRLLLMTVFGVLVGLFEYVRVTEIADA